jgi:hypothetical protein
VCGIYSSSQLLRSARPATPTPSPRAGGGEGRKKERTGASKPQGNRQANLVASQPFSLTGEISPKTEIKDKIKRSDFQGFQISISRSGGNKIVKVAIFLYLVLIV